MTISLILFLITVLIGHIDRRGLLGFLLFLLAVGSQEGGQVAGLLLYEMNLLLSLAGLYLSALFNFFLQWLFFTL